MLLCRNKDLGVGVERNEDVVWWVGRGDGGWLVVRGAGGMPMGEA